MDLLNEDNVVRIFLNKIGDIIIANLLFLVCSIPLITIGPALTALYHCMLRTVKGNNNGTTKTFFRAFRENFKQSLLIWIGLLFIFLILVLNLNFLNQVDSVIATMFRYMTYALIGLVVLIFLYVFPVISALAGSSKDMIRNSFLFAFMHFPSTLVIAIISLLPMYMTYQDLALLPLYATCWTFFGFGLTAYTNSFMFYRMFKPYLGEEEF